MVRTVLSSPVGQLHLAAEGTSLSGLWLEGQAHFAPGLTWEDLPLLSPAALPVFFQTDAFLTAYFHQKTLPPLPILSPAGTPFQKAVWRRLLEIPRGQTVTYGALAEMLRKEGIPACPRSVGSAVGRNPISILIPCHRVLGAGDALTGYAGGVARKRFLLDLEGISYWEKSTG